MLILVCCVVVFCLSLRTFYPFCRVEHPTKGDISPLFNARTNAKLNKINKLLNKLPLILQVHN